MNEFSADKNINPLAKKRLGVMKKYCLTNEPLSEISGDNKQKSQIKRQESMRPVVPTKESFKTIAELDDHSSHRDDKQSNRSEPINDNFYVPSVCFYFKIL
jgi:hypothetical protein